MMSVVEISYTPTLIPFDVNISPYYNQACWPFELVLSVLAQNDDITSQLNGKKSTPKRPYLGT